MRAPDESKVLTENPALFPGWILAEENPSYVCSFRLLSFAL